MSEMIGKYSQQLLSPSPFNFLCLPSIINFLLPDYTKQVLESNREILLLHDQMKVKMELYNERAKEGAVSALKMGMLCKMDSLMDTSLCGNFRKLEVD